MNINSELQQTAFSELMKAEAGNSAGMHVRCEEAGCLHEGFDQHVHVAVRRPLFHSGSDSIRS